MDEQSAPKPPDATVLIPKINVGSEDLAHYLVVTMGPRQGSRHEIPEEPLLIGRSTSAGLDLEDPAVSGRHCRLVLVAGRLMVEDLGSSNGTYIDEDKITEISELKVGSVLQVGGSLLKHELRSRREVERQQAMSGELERAAVYVESLLPPPFTSPSVSTRWRFVPSAKVGGDAFGYNWLDDDHFALYLLDVCGHGAGSALHSVSIINVLRRRTLPGVEFTRPEEVLTALNDAFHRDEHGGMYLTLWYGVYRPRERRLRFASAGHPPALLLSGDPARRLVCRKPGIGLLRGLDYEAQEVEVPERSRLYLYSDGVYELDERDGEHWTLEGFLDLLQTCDPPRSDTLEDLERAVRDVMKGDRFEDDFSLLVTDFP